MNCDDLDRLMANGQRLSEAAMDHIAGCASCQALMAALKPLEELPDASRLARLSTDLASRSKPVRPLPSDAKMVALAIALFLAFAYLATLPVGFKGWDHLSTTQRLSYYGTIILLALLLSISLVKGMIPGSPRRAGPALVAGGSFVVLAILVVILFPFVKMTHFVEIGTVCLRLGLVCSAVSGTLTYGFVRKGYATSPVGQSFTVGFLAGLAGFAVLALFCPVQNVAHVLTWHLGSFVISGIAGALLGVLGRKLATL